MVHFVYYVCLLNTSPKDTPLRHLSDIKMDNFKNYVQVILWGLRGHA